VSAWHKRGISDRDRGGSRAQRVGINAYQKKNTNIYNRLKTTLRKWQTREKNVRYNKDEKRSRTAKL
jgi:hypothetical protein